MQRYNGQLINQFPNAVNGNAAAGAQVAVRLKSTGALVALYATDSLSGGTLPNPLTADAKGFYSFYAPDGVYTLDVSLSGTPQLEIQLQDVASLQSQFNNAVSNSGYIPVGTFAAGCTVSQANGVVSDGSSYWRWGGALPKTVTAGSSPTPTGVGGWFMVNDSGLRGDLASVNSSVLVAGVRADDLAGKAVGIGQRLINRINSQQVDANILVVGDSTGNESYEWVYQLGIYLVSKYPTHSIAYYLWSTGTDNYAAPVTLATGSGSKFINIYNASISGSTCLYHLGQRFNKVFASKKMDLIIQNYGHNQGTDSPLERCILRLTESVSQFIAKQPEAEHVLTLQNEDLSFLAFSERQVYATSVVAELFGLACLDVRSVFLKKRLAGNINDWMADTVHPNAAGHQAWLSVVVRALENPAKHNSAKLNPIIQKNRPEIRNPYFYDWIWTSELPAGFSKVGTVTVTKEKTVNESLSWSLKAVNGAAALGEIRFNLDSVLTERPKGANLILAVRMYVPASATSNAGRVELTSNLGSFSTDPYTEVRDGWTWRLCNLPASMLDTASTLRGSVYVGSSSGDTVYIDRVQICHGSLPHDTYFVPVQLSQLYFPENVAGVGGAAVSVSGNAINVTDTPASFAEFYINVGGLTIGKQYTITWNHPVAGGSCYIYDAANRSGNVITSTAITTKTLTWTAAEQVNSIAFNAPTGVKTLEINTVSIVPV